jgi:hypothetical protein
MPMDVRGILSARSFELAFVKDTPHNQSVPELFAYLINRKQILIFRQLLWNTFDERISGL